VVQMPTDSKGLGVQGEQGPRYKSPYIANKGENRELNAGQGGRSPTNGGKIEKV